MAVIHEKNAISGQDNEAFDHQTLEGKKSGQFAETNGSIHDNQGFAKKDARVDDEDYEEEEEEVDVSCGIGPLRTNLFGRRFANLYVFATIMGISAFFSGMVHSVLHVQLTSIEKQFNIDNTKAGLFDTVSRAGHMTTILFAGHFAKTVNIPLTIGLSGMFQGVLLASPGFLQLADPYELPVLPPASHFKNVTNITGFGDQAKYMCDAHFIANATSHSKRPVSTEPTNQVAYIVILVVQAVKGITDTFHSGFLQTLYMDDNMVDKSKMSYFLGIEHIITDLASPVGRQINGYLTEIPIDLKETSMDPKDGRFVAAWWLAFLIFGSCLTLVSFPILLFPRKLISKKKQGQALKNAVVTFAGGTVEEEIEKPISNQLNVEDTIRKPSVVTIGMTHGISGNTQQRISSSRKNSLASLGQPGSRRPSLFPPVVTPTERKVSLTGDLIFEQTISPGRKRSNIKKQSRTEAIKNVFKDFPRAFLRMLKNPAYLLLLGDIAIVSIPMSGLSIFRSTYVTNQYNVPMSEVTLASGISSAVGHIIGTLASSWLASKVHTRLGYLYIVLGTYVVTVIMTPLYIVFGCDNEPVYGADGPYGVPVNLTGVCDCSLAKVLISCGDDGNNYLSPCHAGCTGMDGKIFTNCAMLANSTLGNSVHPGLCPTKCHTNFIIYVLLHGLQNIASSSATIPRRLFILRIVDPRDRGFATSIFVFFSSLMAIPSPNFFGKMIDDTCLVWDGKFCALYDRDKSRYFISGIDVGVHVVVQITYLLMLALFKWEERKAKRAEAKKSAEQKDLELEEKT
ncbi:solute carrier organic anion transporter family member 2A1-like isoform X1 [Biomphalaria glabrata]|uniref:Solute carrier organic anion transporter family member 2A1-like n=2 Tax=Biomphalaria glabrata TaxID=6526 RepID=A0A9W3BFW1_BIOGL|nr:solute carrier organic anion transporter family member 2A1-like [Biomphalaria glabrata]KAI8750463.1 solute carrier organic anion transporter family member 2A1 isoform X1 [Biomphalaria glabrata]